MPRGSAGSGEAWDFAITSGLRTNLLMHGSAASGGLFSDYESYKRDHLQTEHQCTELGFRFVPLVIEAHGGGVVAAPPPLH